MAQRSKTPKPNGAADKPRARVKTPRTADLPGMEDRAIKPLEDIAHEYADIRDARMKLTTEESTLKAQALKLMSKYGKTIYKHDGVTITVVDGEPDVKVKVKKPGDEADADDHADIAADADSEEAEA